MQGVLSYPEFFLAAFMGGVFLLSTQSDRRFSLPEWLTQPAKSFLLLMPENYVNWITSSLVQANWRSNSSFANFASAKLYLSLVSLISIFFLPIYMVCLVALLTWLAPDWMLALRVKRRQQSIRESLPQALDLMVLCIDAGLGLEATLQRISQENSGVSNALNDELTILGHEILLGKDRETAYYELYRRSGVPELKTLGSALNQASRLGLSIARILRAQSEFIRKKQGQRAEEKALKMPVYMAFPLWFCIMPSLLLLVLGPSLLKFFNAMGGH